MGWVCGTYGGRDVHKVLAGKPEGKRPLGRPRGRWEEWIFRSGEGLGDWMELGSGQGQMAVACEYGNELWGCSIKRGEFLD